MQDVGDDAAPKISTIIWYAIGGSSLSGHLKNAEDTRFVLVVLSTRPASFGDES